jgi:hypothetical protein
MEEAGWGSLRIQTIRHGRGLRKVIFKYGKPALEKRTAPSP